MDTPTNFETEHPHLVRQLDVVPLDILSTPINVIGAGAIGSFVVLTLAKMGFNDITVYDFDEVSVENMNSQFYRFKDIGKQKVTALFDLVKDFTDVEIKAINERYETGLLNGVIISAVDSMSVRKTIWENHKETSLPTKVIIDPRMSVQTALMHVAKPFDSLDIVDYDKSFYSDEDSVQERCTAKATMFTAIMLSGLVANTVLQVLKDERYPHMVQWSMEHNDFMPFFREPGLPYSPDIWIDEASDRPQLNPYGISATFRPPNIAELSTRPGAIHFADYAVQERTRGQGPGLASQAHNEYLNIWNQSRDAEIERRIGAELREQEFVRNTQPMVAPDSNIPL